MGLNGFRKMRFGLIKQEIDWAELALGTGQPIKNGQNYKYPVVPVVGLRLTAVERRMEIQEPSPTTGVMRRFGAEVSAARALLLKAERERRYEVPALPTLLYEPQTWGTCYR